MRVSAVVLIACYLAAACTSWRLETLSPSDVVTQRQPDAVRVDRADGRREVWHRPAIQGDSLVGWSDTAPTPTPYGRWTYKQKRGALALTEIRQVSTREISTSKTLALLGGIAALAAVIAYASTHMAPDINLGPLGGSVR